VSDSLEIAFHHSNGSFVEDTKKKAELPVFYEETLHPES